LIAHSGRQPVLCWFGLLLTTSNKATAEAKNPLSLPFDCRLHSQPAANVNAANRRMTRLFILPSIFAVATFSLWLLICNAPEWNGQTDDGQQNILKTIFAAFYLVIALPVHFRS
jgi:hypothetical protein